MITLSELLERVEKATGADHPLEHEVLLALGAKHDHDWDHEYWFGEVRLLPYDITASIDAAVALVEKKLPGWGWYARKDSEGSHGQGCFAGLTYPKHNNVTPGSATCATPALALIAALLRALIAHNNTGDRE